VDKLRFGLAGVGGIVREFHLPAMLQNPRVKIVAACGVRQDAVQGLAQEIGISNTYMDFERMARDPEIDAVLVATPNYLHAPITVKMLESGKNVLCEKPMATTPAEANKMLATAEAAHKRLAIAHPWRCDQDFRWLHDVIHSGRLGKIFKIRGHAVLTGDSPPADSWRSDSQMAGGGALTDLGIHVMDTISFLFDDRLRPIRVTACVGNVFTKAQVEDTATVLIEFQDGIVAVIDSGWHHNFQHSPHGAIEVFGTEGYARTFPTELQCRADGDWVCRRPFLHPDRPHIDASMYAVQIDSFIDSVVSGSKPACDMMQGFRNVVLLDAIYLSARSAEPVSLKEY